MKKRIEDLFIDTAKLRYCNHDINVHILPEELKRDQIPYGKILKSFYGFQIFSTWNVGLFYRDTSDYWTYEPSHPKYIKRITYEGERPKKLKIRPSIRQMVQKAYRIFKDDYFIYECVRSSSYHATELQYACLFGFVESNVSPVILGLKKSYKLTPLGVELAKYDGEEFEVNISDEWAEHVKVVKW